MATNKLLNDATIDSLTSIGEDAIGYWMTDPSGTPADGSAALSVLRASLHHGVIYVKGTNNATTDTANIQAALTAAASAEPRTVVLCGTFRINDTLVVPTLVRLVGWPYATVSWYGSLTANPAISITGARACVRDIKLYCRFLCRGIKADSCYYGHEPIIANVMVYEPRQIGVDLIDCWYGNVSHLTILAFHGVALHAYRCNAASWKDIRLQTGALHWHTDGATTEQFAHANNLALWSYANTHTNAQTATQYGGDYKTDWPETSEIAEADRAAIVLDYNQYQLHINNLCIEVVACGDLPLICAKHSTSRFDGVYVEGGYHNTSGCLVAIDGDGWKQGTNLAFRNVYILTDTTARCGYFSTLTNTTKNISVDNIHTGAGQLVAGIVNTIGAGHSGTTVTNYLGTTDSDGLVPIDATT